MFSYRKQIFCDERTATLWGKAGPLVVLVLLETHKYKQKHSTPTHSPRRSHANGNPTTTYPRRLLFLPRDRHGNLNGLS